MNIPQKLDIQSIPAPSAAEIIRAISEAISSGRGTGSTSQDSTAVPPVIAKALISNANIIWRIASTVINSETGELKEDLRPQEVRKIGKAVESIMEIFGGLGIRIVDRTGEPFNPGLPDHVVSEETREGISKEQIIRTIRPTIFWKETMVQRGEVDIAVPQNKQ